MIFTPKKLGSKTLERPILSVDKKFSKRFGFHFIFGLCHFKVLIYGSFKPYNTLIAKSMM